MQLIKLAVISLVFFFLLLTGIGLLLPAEVKLSRAVNLSDGQINVLRIIKDTASWSRWHPLYTKAHPQEKRMVQTANDTLIHVTVETAGGTLPNTWQLYRYPNSPVVTLQWAMQIRSGWLPWQRFRSLFYEGTYGIIMEEGLRRLDSISVRSK